MIDPFATRLNHKLPVYVSPVADPLTWEIDALNISWEDMDGYAFCPVTLSTSDTEIVHTQVPSDSNRTRVARDELVLGPHRSLTDSSSIFTNVVETLKTARRKQVSHKPGIPQLTCMAISSSEYVKFDGFSADVEKRIKGPQSV